MDPIAVKDAIHRIILNPDYRPLLAIVKAARNGAVYGAKVRFPHALVMIFLFRSGTVREKLFLVLKATRAHARNLATFAVIYKSTMLALRYANPSSPGKEGPLDTFFAGVLGGYAVFGRRQTSINQQIVIYIFARVVLALAKVAVTPRQEGSRSLLVAPRLSQGTRDMLTRNAWPAFASLSWGMVMYIFNFHPEAVQSSLRSSMQYIYVDCDHWDSLRSFLIHNK